MTRRQDFDDQLRAWAELGDERLPIDYLKAALAQIDGTPQRRALIGWRFPPVNRLVPLALAAAALVVVLLVGIGLILRAPDVGPIPTPGPTQTATPEASATADSGQHAGAWSATAGMINARAGFTATRLTDGRVLVAGGTFDASHRGQAAAELYDPASGTWTATGSMLTGRYRHSATLLSDGKVLVVGGQVDSVASLGDRCCLASAELYDPSTGTWSATGSMIDARVEFIATRLNDGSVLVAGGDGANGSVAGAELYDSISGSWSATAAMGIRSYGWQAALLPNGNVLAVGAIDIYVPEVYDPGSASWSRIECPDQLGGDAYCADWQIVSALPNGTGLVAGTLGAALYDPRAGTWSPTGLPAVTTPQSAVLLLNGTVLMLSPADSTHPALVQLYDPGSGTWTVAPPPSAVRYGAVPTLLLDGTVLLVGGYGDLNQLLPEATAELYDPGS